MWDVDTPPQSPIYVKAPQARLQVSRPEITRDRHSTYYRNVKKQRSQAVQEANEREYGWGSNANAIRETNLRESEPSNETQTHAVYTLEQNQPSLIDLIDKQDLARPPSQASALTAPSTSRVRQFIMKVLFRHMRRKRRMEKDSLASTRSVSKGSSAVQIQQERLSREQFLSARKARGSIIFDKSRGIAQIPLYAAPETAQISSAPALSSFAPRAPLRTSERRPSVVTLSGKQPVAKASATIDMDGNVLDVSRNGKKYSKADGRYSTFMGRTRASSPAGSFV